jgi:hypothetical protein
MHRWQLTLLGSIQVVCSPEPWVASQRAGTLGPRNELPLRHGPRNGHGERGSQVVQNAR